MMQLSPARSLAAAASAVSLCSAKIFMVPMRDGVELHTIVDLPELPDDRKDLTNVVDKSPYGQDAIELITLLYSILLPMAGVRQDMRGTKKSQGNFTIWHDSADDDYDTMQWLTQQSWANDKVPSVYMGFSADGISAYTAVKARPEWLKAYFIGWSTAAGYPIIYPGGAYRKSLTDFWMRVTIPGQSARCVQEIKSHESVQDNWWTSLTAERADYEWIDFRAVLWGGWYDIFLAGNLQAFDGIQHLSKKQGESMLFLDPLGHCQSAGKFFPEHAILGRSALPVVLSLDLFRDPTAAQIQWAKNVSACTFYVMSSTDWLTDGHVGNYWTSLPDFPAFEPLKLYLSNSDSSLTRDPPAAAAPVSAAAESTSFVYDPLDPVPSIGGNNLEIKCGPLDQRPVEQGNRSDVLTYTSAPLTSELALTGPLTMTLYVSSNATDTDFTAKLTDVYPKTGESRLIQDGIVRMKWRHLGRDPQPMVPQQVYEVNVSLWNTSYIFNKGHAVRVSLSSSNYPRYGLNNNTCTPINVSTAPLTALNTVFHSKVHPSHLTLPVVQPAQLPPIDIAQVLRDASQRYQFDFLDFDQRLSAKLGDMVTQMQKNSLPPQ